jgi:pyridoxal phosphate enzyme (YggS family)
MQSDFSQNRLEILQKITAAAKDAGRKPDDITLVAVSKTQEAEKIDAALFDGQRVFGENRVQEAYSHWGERDCKNLELRLIGPLQTNKSDEAVKLFDVIETLDRENLCAALQKSIQKIGKSPKLLMQINIGDEEQKAGVAIGEFPRLLNIARETYRLEVAGLMCIPPAELPPAPFFALMQKLAKTHGLQTLSMGMSSDFETAIKFGATHVRVGTALFGARN